MKTVGFLTFVPLLLVTSLAAQSPRVTPEVPPPQKRQAAVATAERLTQRKPLPDLPAPLISPFNPPDFDKPDPAEIVAQTSASAGAATAPVILGDRETLEKLAAQIIPSGTLQVRGAPRLVIGNKPFEVGTRFTATYNNNDYELELVAIERTTFTLRYRGEEITRPIKPVR
jgi:hypothetical protein